MINKHVVVIGGGTGSFTLLRELKNCFRNVSALVNMADNGGSTGVLRDEYGVLPPGDVRQCLVALSDAPESLRELFTFRFPEGTSLAGHSFGNLFLSAVEMKEGDFNHAIELAQTVLCTKGDVVPVTLDKCDLVLNIGDKHIRGEAEIGKFNFVGEAKPILSLDPKPMLNPKAAKALGVADVIVIAPGNLYRSLIPALLVDGIAHHLQATKVPIIYVANLVNKPTETANFTLLDYINELERFIGSRTITHSLYNNNKPSKKLLDLYALAGELPMERGDIEPGCTVIEGDFLSKSHMNRDQNDTRIVRSLIRHDPVAVCRVLQEIVQ